MPPRRASPRGDYKAYDLSTKSTTSTAPSKLRAVPRTDTRDRARAPTRYRPESVQPNSSRSPPPPTRLNRAGTSKEPAEVSTPGGVPAPVTTPTVSPLSECESPVLPTTGLMSTAASASAGSMMPPALPKTPLKENVPMQQAFSGPADPTSPTPTNKRKRLEDQPQTATPDSFQLQTHGSPSPVSGSNIPPALHAALLVRGPSLQMAQQNPGHGPDYPGSKIMTLRIITHDAKLTSYTKSIVVHNPFFNGQIPAFPFIRHLCEQKWPEKHEAFRHMCDRIDMGMPNSDESYKDMAIRNATALGGPVAKGGPIRMMQLFGLEFVMEVCSEEEWGFFWDEVLSQEPENGLLTVFMAFHTK
ncbi:hypothetical protein EV426DRAFT_572686 [Tirmania nivea]|nr:hypothetical protein EV426DRAFT_572686 [Tirmania nivea]